MPANSNGQKEPSAPRKTEITKKMLILDWDHTITNRTLAGHFQHKQLGDYDFNKEGTITEQDIKEFLEKEGSGIKNEKELKRILKNAFEQGIEICIASSTIYLRVVEYMVKNHLGLTNEQAESVKVIVRNKSVRDFPKHCGKNIHILYLLKQYKADHGTLPQKVMLVDDLERNIQCLGEFDIVMKELQTREMDELLGGIDNDIAKISITDKELNGIEFKGVKIPEQPITHTSANYGYVKQVNKWIGSEHIADNPPKEGTPPSNPSTNPHESQASVYDNTSIYYAFGSVGIGLLAVGVILCAVGMPKFGGIFIAGAVMCALIVGIGKAYENASKKNQENPDISTCADVKTIENKFASYQETPNR